MSDNVNNIISNRRCLDVTNPFSTPNTHFTSKNGVEIYYYYSITFNFFLEYITFAHTLWVKIALCP